MGRITSYPETTELGNSDIFLVDGSNGTRKVSAPNAASEFAKLDEDSYRLTSRLNGAGFDAIKIPNNANLNTLDYIRQGRYYCDSGESAATYQNCPVLVPFMMEVMSLVSPNVDDESTGVWVYRLRKITTVTGHIKYQYVYSQDTAGVFEYDDWFEVVTSVSDYLIRPDMIVIDHVTTIGGDFESIESWIASNYELGRTIEVLVTPTTAGYFGSASFSLRFNLSTPTYGWAIMQSDDVKVAVFGRLNNGTWHWYSPAFKEISTLADGVVNMNVSKDSYTNTNVKNGSAICRRQGNVVSIVAQGGVSSLAANSYVTWVTIGEKYRPTETQFVNVSNGVVSGRFAVINTDGTIQIFSSTTISSSTNFAFNITYVVD